MTYQIPRTEGGEVDWVQISSDMWHATEMLADGDKSIEILKAIDANAREEERGACIEAGDEWKNGDSNDVLDAIRSRGKEQ